jgi:hypothetical protein
MEEQPGSKKAKVVKIDNLKYLIDRHFSGEGMFLFILKGRDLEKKGLLLWVLMKYHRGDCGVAYVHDALVRPFKIFYKYDTKRRIKYSGGPITYAWCEKYYLENNSRELFNQ